MIKVFIGVLLALKVAGLTHLEWTTTILIEVGAILLLSLLDQYARFKRKQLLEKVTGDIEKDGNLDDESKIDLLYLGILTLIFMK